MDEILSPQRFPYRGGHHIGAKLFTKPGDLVGLQPPVTCDTGQFFKGEHIARIFSRDYSLPIRNRLFRCAWFLIPCTRPEEG
jgi:hypothetical protein